MRPGFDANALPGNDDGSTEAVPIGFNVNFFGTTYQTLFVNNNGNVTFDFPLGEYTPFDLTSTEQVIIAPFFADVDTGTGNIVTYGTGVTEEGRPAFGVNWPEVGCYSQNTSVLNDFQVLLIDRSDVAPADFDIEFNYNSIQWEAGQASGGDGSCLGGSAARAGYSNGSGEPGTFFELGGSAVNGAFLDSNSETGLIHGSLNSPVAGRYVFRVRGGVPQPTDTPAATAPATATPTTTESPTTEATATATALPATVPPTATNTPLPPTATALPPTATATPVPPTATRTPTNTPVPSSTRPPTATPSATRPPTRTPTSTPAGPPTAVPTATLPPPSTPPPTATDIPPIDAPATATAEALSIAGATATSEAAIEATATSQAEDRATATSQAQTATASAPTPTRESEVLGAVTPSGSDGGGSPAQRPVFGVGAGEPRTTAAILGFDQISKDAKVIGTNIVLAIILLIVLLLSSTIFNEAVSEHRVELQALGGRLFAPFAWLGDRTAALRPAGLAGNTRLNFLFGPLLLLGVTALVYSFNEPHLAFDGQTALLYSSLLIAIGVTTYIVEGGEALMANRRFGVDAGVRLVPVAIAIAAVFVLISRLVSFDAPIMYGFIASATVLGAAGLDRRDGATAVLVPAIALLAASVGAWLLLPALRDMAQHNSHWWSHVPSEAAAAIFIGGIEGLMFVLLPLRFTDGEKIFRWYRWLWFPLFGICAFLFSWVVLNPQAKAFDAVLEGRVIFVACLVAIYAAVATAFWAYFWQRSRRVVHANVN